MIKRLKDKIIFEPIMVTFASKSEEYAKENCVFKGGYCLMDPEHSDHIKGIDVIMESLRQKCMYKANVEGYFEYMGAFYSKCYHSFTERCSK